MITVQITLFSTEGYKPLSTLLRVESWEDYQQNKVKYRNSAIVKICAKRYMQAYDLRKYGYTEVRVRIYDPEQIAKEKAERYEQIKKERGWT